MLLIDVQIVRGAFKKKMSRKVEKVQKGGAVSSKNQKVQNSKFGFFDKRGEAIFSFFSQIQKHTLDTSVEEKIS